MFLTAGYIPATITPDFNIACDTFGENEKMTIPYKPCKPREMADRKAAAPKSLQWHRLCCIPDRPEGGYRQLHRGGGYLL